VCVILCVSQGTERTHPEVSQALKKRNEQLSIQRLSWCSASPTLYNNVQQCPMSNTVRQCTTMHNNVKHCTTM